MQEKSHQDYWQRGIDFATIIFWENVAPDSGIFLKICISHFNTVNNISVPTYIHGKIHSDVIENLFVDQSLQTFFLSGTLQSLLKIANSTIPRVMVPFRLY
jgi:hypothetical protein